jgi:hypothetical protein
MCYTFQCNATVCGITKTIRFMAYVITDMVNVKVMPDIYWKYGEFGNVWNTCNLDLYILMSHLTKNIIAGRF